MMLYIDVFGSFVVNEIPDQRKASLTIAKNYNNIMTWKI
jgi:hypothetical protein